uniref:30S ribosomal protein S2 n=1 Tax=Junco hyemalis TaxID=40217 RepID=A0A8C5NID6_JUNHY
MADEVMQMDGEIPVTADALSQYMSLSKETIDDLEAPVESAPAAEQPKADLMSKTIHKDSDPVVSVKELIAVGAHYGHQARRWNPNMKPYIYGKKNNLHILDLNKSVDLIQKAYVALKKIVEQGGKVLFVGTKPVAKETVLNEATRSGCFYGKERDRLSSLLGGIKEMRKRPDAIVVVDSNWEHNAVHEAKLLHIHTFGLIDTNCEPSDVEFPIPVNVDGPESVKLIIGLLADAVVAAKGGEAAYAYQADAADAGNMESFIPEDLSKYQFSQDDLKVVHAKIREDIFAAKRKGKKRRKKASKKFVKRPNGGNHGPKDENRGEKAQEAPKATEAAPSEKTEAKPATEETK